MARSIRRTPIFGNCTGHTQQPDKRDANRRLRRATRQLDLSATDIHPLLNDVSSVWDFAYDGKRYHRHAPAQWMRK